MSEEHPKVGTGGLGQSSEPPKDSSKQVQLEDANEAAFEDGKPALDLDIDADDSDDLQARAESVSKSSNGPLLTDSESSPQRRVSNPPAPPPAVKNQAVKPSPADERRHRRSTPPRPLAIEDLMVEEVAMPPLPPPAIPRTSTQRRRPWYEAFFDDAYLFAVRQPSAKLVENRVDFIERSLGLPKGASILDLGCGTGKYAVELACRQYSVIGIDISTKLLADATVLAEQRNQRVNFLRTDMREMDFDATFEGIVCWGTSFGFFDDQTNRQVLERTYKALKPGGRFILELANRDFVIQEQPNACWYETERCVCMEESHFDYVSSRLYVKRTLLLEGGEQDVHGYSVRLYSLHEIGQWLHQVGFKVTQVSGHEATAGVFFGADATRILVVAEKPGGALPEVMPEPTEPEIEAVEEESTKELSLADLEQELSVIQEDTATDAEIVGPDVDDKSGGSTHAQEDEEE